ncbi:hypothetical protein ZIOFF_055129 [Zingiber officinale]|uniref:RRM domain-containing protein n=1 Tax=Zingiber officinale TaxID=94328 RepID=A0A8J5FFB8_ZINOF|nr:hypothetical protein ZIOFF_055129 [Zingiber officinale]
MDATPAGYYHPPTSTGYYHSPPTSSRHPYYSLPPVQASPPSHRAPPLPYSRTPLPPLRQSHHSPPYALHRTPPYGAAYAASGELPSFDEVRTLFVAGLPGDVKVREVYNLFREFPGFWTLTSKFKAYVFSVFTDQQSALAAMHSLNGLVFDIERELSIHIDLAKSNSRSKCPRTDENIYSSDRGVRGSAFCCIVKRYSRFHVILDIAAIIPHMGTHSSKAHVYTFTRLGTIFTLAAHCNKQLAYDSEHNNLGNSKSNLATMCRCPGFLTLKMQNKSIPVAFIDFEDVGSSTAALNHLQGTFLLSSISGTTASRAWQLNHVLEKASKVLLMAKLDCGRSGAACERSVKLRNINYLTPPPPREASSHGASLDTSVGSSTPHGLVWLPLLSSQEALAHLAFCSQQQEDEGDFYPVRGREVLSVRGCADLVVYPCGIISFSFFQIEAVMICE